MTAQTVQQFVDSGSSYFWFCKKCDHARKLDMVRFGRKFGLEHSAAAADVVPRLRCTRCKNAEIGLMRQTKESQALEVVLTHPPEKVSYVHSRAERSPDLYASGSCVYRLDSQGEIIEIAAWAKSSLVARKALEALREQAPTEKFQQRRRAWVESD